MRALLKNSRKIVINQVDPNERALISEFITKSAKKYTTVRSLYDIDNELDGVSFELTRAKNIINYKTPDTQVIAMANTSYVDLKLDSETTVEINNKYKEFLEVFVEDNNIISIKAKTNVDLLDTTQQYTIIAILSKDGYEPAIVPINVMVLYIQHSSGAINYEELNRLPKINHVVLLGDRDLEELGIQGSMERVSENEIDGMFSE